MKHNDIIGLSFGEDFNISVNIVVSSFYWALSFIHMYVLYLMQYCTYFKIINCYRNLCFQMLKNVGKFSASVLTIVRPKDYNKEISHKTYSNN